MDSLVSLSRVAASPVARGWMVRRRAAYARRKANQAGLRRPALSTTDHDIAGQQSLSCHHTVPEHHGVNDRRCSMPTVIV